MSKTINYCVVGLGSISNRIIKGIQESSNSKLYAVCSSNKEKAIKVQARYKDINLYSDISKLPNDKNIDIVYIATPNFVHFEQIEFLLKNNMNVICEKPMCINEKNVKILFELAKMNKCFLMEAQKTVFSPLLKEVLAYIKKFGVDRICRINANYNDLNFYSSKPKTHWVFDKEVGGANLDLAGYPISFILAIFKHFNIQVKDFSKEAHTSKDGYIDDFKVEISPNANFTAIAQSSWITGEKDIKGFAEIEFETGITIKIDHYWKNNLATICSKKQIVETIEVEKQSDFQGEIEHASNCLLNDLKSSPVLDYEFTKLITNMIVYK